MNCSNCNERIDDNSVFCPNCGEKVLAKTSNNNNNNDFNDQTTTERPSNVVNKKNDLNFKRIAPIAIVVVLLLGAFMLFGSGGKPETTVNNLFKSIDKVDPEMMLDTLSSYVKNEILYDIDWDKSELAYELSEMKEEFRSEMGNDWIKQIKITKEYSDKNSAIVGVSMFGEYEKLRLVKEGKKWVLVESPF